MNYPLTVQVKMAPGKGGKQTLRAFDTAKGNTDLTRTIVYATLVGAYQAGMWLHKAAADSRWKRIEQPNSHYAGHLIQPPKAKGKAQPTANSFAKLKAAVLRKFPDARTQCTETPEGYKTFLVVYGPNDKAIVDPQLMIPPAQSVLQAWQIAKQSIGYRKLLTNNSAEQDDKIYSKLAKQSGGGND